MSEREATTVEPVAQRKVHRSWPQRLMIAGTWFGAFACFLTAGAIGAGQWVLSQRNLTELADTESEARGASDPQIVVPGTTIAGGAAPAATTTPSTTIPLVLAEPEAANFLIVGADNNDCAENAITEDRSDIGERSDTIMVWRANPDTNQLAVLSFPRDLYVEYPTGRKDRINAAYRRNDSTLLREVINFNFGIEIDHYVQIDFCAFRKLVDAVGGVGIPFEFPARDQPKRDNPPLFLVEQTGCVTLDGNTALAYVRSRYYQYEDPPGSGNWQSDGTSDFGRISRQQDFLRRVLAKVIDQGLYDPSVANALITTNREYLVTDPDLTVRRMLEFASALQNFDADAVRSYRIESTSRTINGADVQIPTIRNDEMQAILSVFRGEATLADAPEQELDATTISATTEPSESSEEPVADEPSTDESSGEAASATTLPVVEVEENQLGIVPDRTVTCD
jgi:LCP family protein required for cell wall assembly